MPTSICHILEIVEDLLLYTLPAMVWDCVNHTNIWQEKTITSMFVVFKEDTLICHGKEESLIRIH
jgi:hypothetical protein